MRLGFRSQFVFAETLRTAFDPQRLLSVFESQHRIRGMLFLAKRLLGTLFVLMQYNKGDNGVAAAY